MSKKSFTLMILVLFTAMIIPTLAFGDSHIVNGTLLHTNDFHGRLETDSSGRGGSAYISDKVNDIRAAVGSENVLLLDAGDEYFAAPAISQLLMGESTIDVYNMMGYDAAAFGNHEFDKGQEVLNERTAQADYPWLGANIVLEGTEWDHPAYVVPYTLLIIGEAPHEATIGVIGVATDETPQVTLIGTTEGLEFKSLTESVMYYYDEVMAQADALIVVAHMGTDDSGPYEGLETLAQNLIDAGKPVDLMIGGHQHQALFDPVWVGDTAIVAAGYYGRWLGQVDFSVNVVSKELTVDDYQLNTITAEATLEGVITDLTAAYEAGMFPNKGSFNSLLVKLTAVQAAIARGDVNAAYGSLNAFMNEVSAQSGKHLDPDLAEALYKDVEWIVDNTDLAVLGRVGYWAEIVAPIVNQPVGYTNLDLERDYNDESNMGDIVTDSMRWSADLYDDGVLNGSVDIAFTNAGGLRADILIPDGATLPHVVTWGDTFDVLPFGNTLYLMDLTGAQIQDVLDQSATLYKGILQTSGANWYWYNDCGCDAPTAWGAYGVQVDGEPLDRDRVYRIVTNNYVAGGQDGYETFAEGTHRWDTYYDMQEGFVEYIGMLGTIDAEDVPMGRIVRLDEVVTMLHVNDTHGDWPADAYYGSPQGFIYLASLVNDERAHNPNALLLDAGDTFQGNSFAYFFKDRPDNPIAGGMNLLEFDGMVVGNHEFNFGPTTFATMLEQVAFPIMGSANLDDDGSYGFVNENMVDYINLDVNDMKVTVFGLTNPRVYRYELPTNIEGLTFYPALDTAETLVPDLLAAENPDLLVGLTHIGESPYGGEIDSDELLAENIAGIDVLIGGHSHSRIDPAYMHGSDLNPDGTLIAQDYKYAIYLGQVNVGWIDGEIVLREGFLIPAAEAEEDPAMAAYLAPYSAEIDAYNATVIGESLVPIDGSQAYTEETSSANLQADSAVFVLDASGVTPDVHLSGAMSNTAIGAGILTKGDMFSLMPYENSLVVLSMNGPQIKDILERSYRNWWWYNQGSPWGDYSHYTTCMLATNDGNVITYSGDLAVEPDGNNVVSLTIQGEPVDFTDASTDYLVSTVNYVAAGSCNFNNDGETIWPLDQIIADTQLYVRDSVINYVDAQPGPIAPAVEGRLVFP
jgi:5'-nucleotidase